MFRLIPLLLMPLFVGSGVGLWWYGDLSKEDRTKADAIAADYAAKLYQKAVSELSSTEAENVKALVKKHFAA
jgi:hypothetical protein